jgi:hypothetical protein
MLNQNNPLLIIMKLSEKTRTEFLNNPLLVEESIKLYNSPENREELERVVAKLVFTWQVCKNKPYQDLQIEMLSEYISAFKKEISTENTLEVIHILGAIAGRVALEGAAAVWESMSIDDRCLYADAIVYTTYIADDMDEVDLFADASFDLAKRFGVVIH